MPASRPVPRSARSSFLVKIALAASLLTLSDGVFWGYRGGAVIGGFALVWLAALAVSQAPIRCARFGWIATAAAAGFALVLIDDPSLLATVLFLAAIGSGALLPRHGFDHAGCWFARLAALAVKGPLRAPADLLRVARLPTHNRASARSIGLHLGLPFIGGAVFLALFASANPVLGNVFGAIRLPDFTTLMLHALLLAVTLSLVWPTFRPRAIRFAERRTPTRSLVPDPPVRTMLLTLAVFNAVFAVENALDIVFLWSGAGLPPGVTLADYAHRGAYTLIVTALLAAGFVLLALRPGSAAADHPTVRRLLLAWVAQNILLVASSVLRLLDYIDAYSLTVLRISALAWMVLVAIGLALICWRLLAGRSAAWLINANALAALTVLSLASVFDLGAVAAAWNVAHVRDPARLDPCYLRSLGSSALIPLIRLRDAPVGAATRDQAVYLSQDVIEELRIDQADWHSWTFRGARRLDTAERLLANDRRTPAPAPYGRGWCGGINEPPAPSATTIFRQAPSEQATTQPLTAEQNR